MTAPTRAQVADMERTLVFNVAQQFVAVLLAESTLRFAELDLKSFQDTVNIGLAQYQSGYISEGDYLKIKLQLLQFQTDVSSARLARVQALVALRQLLGYDAVPANYDVVGDLSYQPVTSKLEELQAKAHLMERPDYRAAVFRSYRRARSFGEGEWQTRCQRVRRLHPHGRPEHRLVLPGRGTARFRS